jgi:hypothetical protein
MAKFFRELVGTNRISFTSHLIRFIRRNLKTDFKLLAPRLRFHRPTTPHACFFDVARTTIHLSS